MQPTLEVLAGETGGWLHVLHRVKDDRDVFFICNQNDKGPARQFKFRATAAGEPECWDAMRNEITAIPFQRTGEKTRGIFARLWSRWKPRSIVFQPKKQARPARIEAGVEADPRADRRRARSESRLRQTARRFGQSFGQGSFRGLQMGLVPRRQSGRQRTGRQRAISAKRSTFPPAGKSSRRIFALTADNDFVLYVNGTAGLQERRRSRKLASAENGRYHETTSSRPKRPGHRRHQHGRQTEPRRTHRPLRDRLRRWTRR